MGKKEVNVVSVTSKQCIQVHLVTRFINVLNVKKFSIFLKLILVFCIVFHLNLASFKIHIPYIKMQEERHYCSLNCLTTGRF